MEAFILVFLNLLFPTILILKKCIVKRKGVVLNHNFFFSVGYVYYWIIPIIIGLLGFYNDDGAMVSWYKIFNKINEDNICKYLIFTLLIFIAFFVGSMICIKANESYKKLSYDKNLMWIYIIIVSPLIILSIYKFRFGFFKGYSDVNMEIFDMKGQFAATSMFVLSIFLLYTQENKKGSFSKDINNIFAYIYFIIAILLLSLGGRLYFITSVLTLMCVYTNYYREIKIKSIFIIFIVIMLGMGIIGVFRLGSGNKNLLFSAIFNVFEEPLYTSFSLIHFIEKGNFRILEFPISLISNFVNLIPTAIFPNKANYFITPESMGYTIYSPLGALNSFFSFNINFGLIGTIIFMFVLSLILNKLSKNKYSSLSKVIYVMVSSNLIFTFFRDPFSASLIKNIFQFSIVMPIIIVILSNILMLAAKNINKLE